MGIDLVNLKDELKMFEDSTLPKLQAAGRALIDEMKQAIRDAVRESLDELDGRTITIKLQKETK